MYPYVFAIPFTIRQTVSCRKIGKYSLSFYFFLNFAHASKKVKYFLSCKKYSNVAAGNTGKLTFFKHFVNI